MGFFSAAVFALALAIGFLASQRGGLPERIGAGIIVGWMALDGLRILVLGAAGFGAVDPAQFTLDGLELMAMTWLALNANRVWPIWAAAAQLICVSGHVAALIEPDGMRRAYWAMTQLPQYIQLLALLLGAFAHERRERRLGRPYRSWRVV